MHFLSHNSAFYLFKNTGIEIVDQIKNQNTIDNEQFIIRKNNFK